jgi:hypothetical protein
MGDSYQWNVESGNATQTLNNRIGIVMTLDCSQSMGTAFPLMKSAAAEFVTTLQNAATN